MTEELHGSTRPGPTTTESITAKQIFDRLSPYDLNRVTFQLPDGLPIVAAYIDTDTQGGAVITLSDTSE